MERAEAPWRCGGASISKRNTARRVFLTPLRLVSACEPRETELLLLSQHCKHLTRARICLPSPSSSLPLVSESSELSFLETCPRSFLGHCRDSSQVPSHGPPRWLFFRQMLQPVRSEKWHAKSSVDTLEKLLSYSSLLFLLLSVSRFRFPAHFSGLSSPSLHRLSCFLRALAVLSLSFASCLHFFKPRLGFPSWSVFLSRRPLSVSFCPPLHQQSRTLLSLLLSLLSFSLDLRLSRNLLHPNRLPSIASQQLRQHYVSSPLFRERACSPAALLLLLRGRARRRTRRARNERERKKKKPCAFPLVDITHEPPSLSEITKRR